MTTPAPRPVALIILDGYGHNPDNAYNAVAAANTPVMDARLKPDEPELTSSYARRGFLFAAR